MSPQNHFEELVDQLMIDEVSLQEPELRQIIEVLDPKAKRLAILSVLDKDRKLHGSIGDIIKSNKVYDTEHIRDVVRMLRTYVRVAPGDKENFGEVMTPIELVGDMLSALPNEVWKNPNLKWLDPCNGVGTFPSMIVWRLMLELGEAIPNEEERYKHIMENMIYVCELQPKNMFLHLCAFDPRDEYDLNIFNGSFLSDEFRSHMKNEWCVDEFDIIVMNPPYNPNSLWKKFVRLGIDLLNDNGKMVAIHPSTWREISTHEKLCNELKIGISKLHVMDFTAFEDEKTNVTVDWYLYNKSRVNNTKVYYVNGESEILDLNAISRILRISTRSIPYSILNKITSDKHNGIIKENPWSPMYKAHDQNGKYRQCGGEGNGTGWTTGNFMLTNEPSEHQYEDKVVMAYVRRPRAQFFSKEDAVGVIRANYWLTNNRSLPILLNSKMLWKICVLLTPNESWRKTPSVRYITPWILETLNFDGLTAINDKELYEHYKLTPEEIAWIEND